MPFVTPGPVMFISGHDATVITGLLRVLGFERANRERGGALDWALPLIEELTAFGSEWTAEALSGSCGSAEVPQEAELVQLHLQPEMTSEEAAEVLDMTPRAARAAAQEGRLKGRKVGRSWRIDAGSVAAELERRRIGAKGVA